MFNVGDIVSYPMHGVGKIETIEEKEILGNTGLYYTLFFFFDGIQISIPTGKAEEVGMRKIISKEEAKLVLERLKATPEKEDSNWNRRYRVNLEKLRTGDVFLSAEVVKTLHVRNSAKGLSAGEKKLLENAMKFLIGELVYSLDISEEEATQKVESILNDEDAV